MNNSTEIENKLIDAIQVIVDDAVNSAGYDRTIQATIISCENKNTGRYKVKYQDSTFFAYAETIDIEYKNGNSVWVLIPGNDMRLNKTILGTVVQLGEDYSKDEEIYSQEDLYDKIGNNCIKSEDIFNLCSYFTNVRILYDRDNNINLINLDPDSVNNYLKKSKQILCGATFRTELPNEQKMRGNYGIIYEIDFFDNTTEQIVTRKYILDINKIIGEPYNLIRNSYQSVLFGIDAVNLNSVKKVYLFVKDFPFQEPGKPEDIFISNIELYGCNELTEEQLKTDYLSLLTPKGTFFKKEDAETASLTIIPQIRIRNKVVDPKTWKFYWFEENASIDEKSSYYNIYGGNGWKCINKNDVVTEEPLKLDWDETQKELVLKKKDLIIKNNTYKCAAISGDIQLSAQIDILNNGAEYDVTIESNNGVEFHYDKGNPTLTCKINDKGYMDKEHYRYEWIEIDNTGTVSSLPETLDMNEEYESNVVAYNQINIDERKGKILHSVAERKRQQYLTVIKKYDTITRIDMNKVINIQVNEITDFRIFKCAAYRDNIYLGTGSIKLYNTIENVEEKAKYHLVLNDGKYIYKYNGFGVAPTDKSLQNPMTIKPLSFSIFDENGQELPKEALNKCFVEWTVPIKDTMLDFSSSKNKPVEEEKEENTLDEEIVEKKYKGLQLYYNIANKFDINKIHNNVVKLLVKYNEFEFSAETTFTFTKEGNQDINGAEELLRIIPNCDVDKMPTYPMVIVDKDGNKTWNFISNDSNQLFRIEFWHNNEDISKKISGNVKWSILRNKYSFNKIDKTSLIVPGMKLSETSISDNFDYTEYLFEPHSDIIRCEFIYNNIKYFATLPIISVKLLKDNYDIKLKENSGFRNASYTSDGRRPQYDDTNPFEIIVTKLINGIDEDISCIEIEEHKIDYIWDIEGTIYSFELKEFIDSKKLQIEDKKTEKRNQKWIKPINEYDGETVTNAIRCSIVNRTEKIGEIYIPIHLYLNRYGQAHLNDWDGNSIQINENGGYILSPQIGAGIKNQDNTFTGMLMGEVQEPGRTKRDIGLLGYANGIKTMFLDAESGGAIFGKRVLNISNGNSIWEPQGGQIIIDPSHKALLYSSKFFSKYKENGFPQDVEENGENLFSKTGEGLLIDLDEPKIVFGSGKFSINKEGEITAKGGGTIAGWQIGETELKSTNNTIVISSYENGKIYSGKDSLNSKTDGFYIGTDGISLGYNNNFKVTNEGNITGQKWSIDNTGLAIFENIEANVSGHIGGWTISSEKISTASVSLWKNGKIEGGSTFHWEINENGDTTFNKINAITGKIGNWTINSDGGISNENVTLSSNGEIIATSGKIGGWIIGPTELYNGNLHLDSNGNLRGGTSEGNSWRINSNGTATFTNITANIGGSIAGWKITSSGLSKGNTKFTSSGSNGKFETSGWIITENYIKNKKSGENDGGDASIFSNGSLALYPKVNLGGTFLINDGARISMTQGVGISSSSNGQVKASSGNIDIKACSSHTVYIASMATAGGETENSAVNISQGETYIKGKNSITLDTGTDGLYLKAPSILTYKHQSTNTIKGIDQNIEIRVNDGNNGYNYGYIGFANGLCVYAGSSKTACSSATGTSDFVSIGS